MGKFNEIVMTQKGSELQNKAQIGIPLVFTRMAVGDGFIPEGTDIGQLESLVNEKLSMDISDMKVPGDGTSRITGIITNQGLSQGFFVREIGLFANDPDRGEILYAVANSYNLADFLPAGGGTEIVENTIELITIVGNAENVTAVIDDSLVYATRKNFLELSAKVDNEVGGSINTLSINQISLAIELETLKGAALNGITANMFVETFLNIDDITLLHGKYDDYNRRLYA